jgi:sigma-B regulation protein RsbU (phosphoserine phosphatase)
VNTLIVEDDNIMRRMLRRAAMSIGHEVTGCVTAEKALEACQANKYPLIILDWILPGMDGLEFCRRIRRMPDGEDCIIIMVTARNKPEDLLAVLDAGADDYIAKPFDLKLLKTRITVAERMVLNQERRRRAEEEKVRLISGLKEALDKIKTLKGLRTICEFCNKVRGDGDSWLELEAYIKENSEELFTHSVCPVCIKEHGQSLSEGES